MDGYQYDQRAHCPRASDCSLDWQRNDCLGWKYERHRHAEYGREILRATGDGNTDTFTEFHRDTYANGYSYRLSRTHASPFRYFNGHRYGHTHRDSHCDGDHFGYGHSGADACFDAITSSSHQPFDSDANSDWR